MILPSNSTPENTIGIILYENLNFLRDFWVFKEKFDFIIIIILKTSFFSFYHLNHR